MSTMFEPWHPGKLATRLALHVLTDREWSRGRDMLSVAAAALDGGAQALRGRGPQRIGEKIAVICCNEVRLSST